MECGLTRALQGRLRHWELCERAPVGSHYLPTLNAIRGTIAEQDDTDKVSVARSQHFSTQPFLSFPLTCAALLT